MVAKVCFGYELIRTSQPRLAFDLRQVPKEIRRAEPALDGAAQKDKLDLVAAELERLGAGDALRIRNDALRGLAIYMRRTWNKPSGAVGWLATRSGPLAIWVAWICAGVVGDDVQGGRKQLHDALAYFRGESSQTKDGLLGWSPERDYSAKSTFAVSAIRSASKACAYRSERAIQDEAEDACQRTYLTLTSQNGSMDNISAATELLWDAIEENIVGYPVFLTGYWSK